MTNSTPTLLIWLVQYRKYLDLVQQDLLEQAELVKAEINEALPDAELCWEDLERAAQNPRIMIGRYRSKVLSV
jgi:hypothetical protein